LIFNDYLFAFHVSAYLARLVQQPISEIETKREGTAMTTMVGAIGPRGQNAHVAHVEAGTAGGDSVARNVALFFAAPFIGLAYVIAFPFVGVYAAVKALARNAG
jgi:hypothetical protein